MTYKVIDWQEELKPFWAKTVNVTPHPNQVGISLLLDAIDSFNQVLSKQQLVQMALEESEKVRGEAGDKICLLLESYQAMTQGEMENISSVLEELRSSFSLNRV